ncbi:hypothetical protein BAE44_0016429, partial [Dichanthelium oligosanthes]
LDVINFGISHGLELGHGQCGQVGPWPPCAHYPLCCRPPSWRVVFSRGAKRSCRTDLIWSCMAWACRCSSTVA